MTFPDFVFAVFAALTRFVVTSLDATVDWLREQGLEVADSDANFALFGRFADRHAVWQGLVDRGVLIRETGPDGWLRVSIGTAEEMAAFKKALLDTIETTKEPA